MPVDSHRPFLPRRVHFWLGRLAGEKQRVLQGFWWEQGLNHASILLLQCSCHLPTCFRGQFKILVNLKSCLVPRYPKAMWICSLCKKVLEPFHRFHNLQKQSSDLQEGLFGASSHHIELSFLGSAWTSSLLSSQHQLKAWLFWVAFVSLQNYFPSGCFGFTFCFCCFYCS